MYDTAGVEEVIYYSIENLLNIVLDTAIKSHYKCILYFFERL